MSTPSLRFQTSRYRPFTAGFSLVKANNKVPSSTIKLLSFPDALVVEENLGALEMKDYFIDLSESILDSFGAHKRIEVEYAMNALNVDVDTAVPLGLIVNELLTNAIKCAFPNGRNGKVQIKLEQKNNGVLQMQISDNGVGKSGVVNGTGFGSQLISLLIQQLDGTMKAKNHNGTHVMVEFKAGRAT